MTWFRVGGAGIPASLKNNMNSVLNKKFGTTGQNYPPNGWPADVNLLGPLPEKTVAGAIAHTDDAADTVPVKSMICSIVPKQAGSGTPSPTNIRAISGSSQMKIYQTGKNLLLPCNADIAEITQNGIKKSYSLNNQEFTFEGTNTKTDAAWLIYAIVDYVFDGLKAGVTYIFSHNLPDYMYSQFTYNKTGGGVGAMGYLRGNTGRNAYVSFSLPSDFDSLRNFQIGVSNTATDVNISAHFQVEVASSASSFEKYNSVADVSDSWSSIGAIYGGERDLTLGTLKKTYNCVDLGSFTWVKVTNNVEKPYFSTNAAISPAYKYMNSNPNVKCSHYSYGSIGETGTANGFYIIVSSYIRIRDDAAENMSADEFKTYITGVQIAYELETSVDYSGLSTYDFETLYAVNNFYSDIEGGQTQVTYRQDIALALQAVSSSRGLMMASRPVTQLIGEESDPDQVNELVENDETEQEGEDNAR